MVQIGSLIVRCKVAIGLLQYCNPVGSQIAQAAKGSQADEGGFGPIKYGNLPVLRAGGDAFQTLNIEPRQLFEGGTCVHPITRGKDIVAFASVEESSHRTYYRGR